MSVNVEPLSVLHIVSYYPPDRVGGVGEHVRLIHEGHLNLGLDSEILTSGATSSDHRVHRIGRTPTTFVLKSWRWARLAKGRDLIHAHHGEGLLALLFIRARRQRPRILAMFHVDVRKRELANRPHWFEGRRYGPTGMALAVSKFRAPIKAAFERAVWLLADEIVVETDAVRRELSDLRPRKRVAVIPHGLGASSEISANDPKHVELLFVGTPGLRKRTHLLPRVLHRVRESIPDARLRIVGFDSEGDLSLAEQARSLGVLSAIEFVGPVRSEEVVPYYRTADVLLLPSAYEGLPMVLLEAMREGLVPVTTDLSGHPEAIVNGENGYLVALDDVDGMADRCIRLLEDTELLERLSRQATQTVKVRFSLERELNAYVDLYWGLLGEQEHVRHQHA